MVCLLFFTVGVSECSAQATCASVVSFQVQRADSSGPSEIFFDEARAIGSDEESSKAQLDRELLKIKARAYDFCKSEYENQAGCLQAKLGAANSALRSASFSARKALEEALQSDCKKQQGVCKEAKSSEPKCVVIVPTPTPDPKAAKAADKGKK